MKLFQAKMKLSRAAAAMPGRASGMEMRKKVLQPAMAVEPVGQLDVLADVLEVAAHDPQHQRQGDELVDPYQAEVGVIQPELWK